MDTLAIITTICCTADTIIAIDGLPDADPVSAAHIQLCTRVAVVAFARTWRVDTCAIGALRDITLSSILTVVC